jgi:WD repeat-containing protein 35
MAWSQDSPSLFAGLERQRFIVFNDLQPEEPIQSLFHIASFRNLELLCVDLLRLMQDPMNPGARIFKRYPTLSLRTLRTMLSNQPDQVEAFCRAQRSKKLWKELGNSALALMNFPLAEKCFLETANYKSLQFIKRVRLVRDGHVQRAQVLSYMGKFAEAQTIYNSVDRLDLAIEMRRTVGDFESVIKIHVGDDESLSQAHRQVGDSQMEKCNWVSAASSYEAAGDDEQLIKCLYLCDDISGLERVMERLPATSPLLPILG